MYDVGIAWCYINTVQYGNRYLPLEQFEDTKLTKDITN